MAKKKQDVERPQPGRRTLNMTREVHDRLVEWCGDAYTISAVGTEWLSWVMEQSELLKLAILHRKRIGGDAALKAAFCAALTQYAQQVCAAAPASAEHSATGRVAETSRGRTRITDSPTPRESLPEPSRAAQ
jgi:hypothetical protein